MSANNIYSDRTLKRQAKRRAYNILSEVNYAESEAADINVCLEKNETPDEEWDEYITEWVAEYGKSLRN